MQELWKALNCEDDKEEAAGCSAERTSNEREEEEEEEEEEGAGIEIDMESAIGLRNWLSSKLRCITQHETRYSNFNMNYTTVIFVISYVLDVLYITVLPLFSQSMIIMM